MLQGPQLVSDCHARPQCRSSGLALRRGLCSGRPVPGACSSGLPTARRRSPDAWRARRAWSRAAAWSGALTPPWPRSASASAARVTVTKHSAPPCHNKSPGAPAAGDPYPLLAAATTLRGLTGSVAGCALGRGHALPSTRDRGQLPELAPHRILRGRSLTSVPPPPGCLCRCHASNPRRLAATRRASERSGGGRRGGASDRGSGAAGSRATRVGGAGGRKRAAGTQRRFQPFLQVPGGGSRAWVWAALGGCLRVKLSSTPPAEPAPADPPTACTVQLDPSTWLRYLSYKITF